MDNQMSKFIISRLSNNTNLLVRDEKNNRIIDSKVECNCGSVIFIYNKPGTMYYDDGEFDQSFNFDLPLKRPYKWYLKNLYEKQNNLIPNNLNSKTTTEFDILCLDWNKNEMWKILLDIIIEYHNSKK